MDQISQVRLVRKFNCKQKINYHDHLWLILRVQLTYEVLIILVHCIINMSLHFHLSHIYTTEFWTNEIIASSNFGLAISSLLMIPYTVKVEQAKGVMVKDLHFTMLVLHIIICFIYSHFTLTISYVLFACLVGAISITISAFSANIVQQKNLHNQIMKIENEDRKGLKASSKNGYDHHEHHQLTQQINDSL